MAKVGAPTKITCLADIPINTPVVYKIVDSASGKAVYVGKTKNPKVRFRNYFYKHTKKHNIGLEKFMSEHDWHIELFDEVEDIDLEEKKQIKKRKGRLFNMVGGGEQSWRKYSRKPWSAKTGVHCPSNILLMFLFNRNKKAHAIAKTVVSEATNKMSDYERSLFEVEIAKEWTAKSCCLHEKIDNWLSYTQDRLIEALEAGP